MKDNFDRIDGSEISFDNGILNATVYSYKIDSFGVMELGAQETRELYEAMKEYYDSKEPSYINPGKPGWV